jgi:hypothetical protein
MGLDGKNDAHFDGSSVEVVSRLEGPSGPRVRRGRGSLPRV